MERGVRARSDGLCLPDIDGSLAELAIAYEQLNVDGVVLLTNYADRYLGDPAFAALFDELQRRKAIVFVHPSTCTCMTGIDTGVPLSSIEFPHDTTRAVVSLWTSGTFSRCRGIRFILPHAGGNIPYIATRVARLNPRLADTLPLLKRQFYDVALSTYPQVLAALTQFAGTSQIVFGTDYPFGAVGATDPERRRWLPPSCARHIDAPTRAIPNRPRAMRLQRQCADQIQNAVCTAASASP